MLPVFNEEKALPGSLATLHAFLSQNLDNPWRIVIADNGSEDATPEVGQELARQYSKVSYLRIEDGRSRIVSCHSILNAPSFSTSAYPRVFFRGHNLG